MPGEAVVTDVGSTKRETMAAARALPDRLTFIGGHPLAGAAVGGVEVGPRGFVRAAARGFSHRRATRRAAAHAGVSALVEALGARVHLMTPEAHDSLVAYLSHLPQLAASALMHLVGERTGAEGLALAGRGLRDTTRLASSPPDIWRDISASNADNIARAHRRAGGDSAPAQAGYRRQRRRAAADVRLSRALEACARRRLRLDERTPA